MDNKLTMFDYSVDWALKDRYIDPKPSNGYLTREETIQFFGTLGIEGVELMHPYWEDCSAEYVKQVCADAGLPIVSYIYFVDLALPTPAERRKAIDQVRGLLDRTAELGAHLAMIVPAVVKDGLAMEDLRGWMIEGLRASAEHAATVGVTLACENLDYPPARPLMGAGEVCFNVCKDVDSPAFRLIFDTSAPLFLEEHPLDALRAMAPYVVHVHLKNSRPLLAHERATRFRDTIHFRRFTGAVLDGGLVQIPPILAELRQMKYEGYLLVEYQGENDPRPALQYNVEYVRRQMREEPLD